MHRARPEWRPYRCPAAVRGGLRLRSAGDRPVSSPVRKLSLPAAQNAARAAAPEPEVVGLDGTPLPLSAPDETAAVDIADDDNLDRRPEDFLAVRTISPGEQEARIRQAF